MRTRILALAASILVLTSTPARAQLPTTIAPDLFAFPGGHITPGSENSRNVADVPFGASDCSDAYRSWKPFSGVPLEIDGVPIGSFGADG